MAIAHLIYGFVGTGKTTHATKLEKELPALRFSIDEWIIALHGQNPSADKFEAYYARTVDLIWSVAIRVLELDQDVILDFGFWSRKSRDEARQRVQAVGAKSVLYHVTCADESMQARVLSRTAAMPEHALYIDKSAIEAFRERFEPLADEEAFVLVWTD